MKKMFYFFVILILGLFVLVSSASAVTQIAGEMTINHDEPLFPNTTVWYPGLTLRNTIEVTNTGGSIRGLGIRAVNTAQTGGLADVLIFKIDDDEHYVYGQNNDKTMKDFWDMVNEFEAANLGPHETKTIGFTAYMPETLGNEYQETQAQFDIMIGFLNQSSVILTVSGGGGAGTVLAVTSNPFAGFFGPFEEVLSETTSSVELSPTPSPTVINIGQVKGAMTKNFSKYIFPIVLLILLILLILYFYKRRNS